MHQSIDVKRVRVRGLAGRGLEQLRQRYQTGEAVPLGDWWTRPD
jgi:hypothetical protein